jgi:hypothetical protein
MKTARETAHDFMRLLVGEDCGRFGDTCDTDCDYVTAAIEARDAEHEADKDRTAEVLAHTHMAHVAALADLEAARSQLETAVGALTRVEDYLGKHSLGDMVRAALATIQQPQGSR